MPRVPHLLLIAVLLAFCGTTFAVLPTTIPITAPTTFPAKPLAFDPSRPLILAGQAWPPPSPLSLWYRQPAKRWLEALPIGNGRIGVMVFGGVVEDRLALSETTLWSGEPSDKHENPAAAAHLVEIRQLLFEGNYKAANPLIAKYMLGRELNYGTNLALGDLLVTLALPTNQADYYRRDLSLDEGIARVQYNSAGVHFNRTYLASHPAGVVAARYTADQPGQISLNLRFRSDLKSFEAHLISPDALEITGNAFETKHSDGKTGVQFCAIVRIVPEGGQFTSQTDHLSLQGANAATIVVAVNTNYQHHDPEKLCADQIATAAADSFDTIRALHLADYQPLFHRVDLNLGIAKTSSMPTSDRLDRLRLGLADPQLEALFFQYGRYLLIAGSRADSPLPTNLQGIWNDGLASAMGWTCDYHLDINTEQNYWPAEVCNLSECAQPLFRLIDSLRAPGRRTAKTVYGCEGWVCHWATNAWGFTAPGWGAGWGLEDVGGAWIASHLWEHYAFTGDKNFLATRAYPVLKEAAEFFLQDMDFDPKNGFLVSGPAPSCENSFKAPDGVIASESMGCTHDRLIIYALFTNCIEASRLLGIDADFRAHLETARASLPPLKVGKHGQLQEWLDDYEEAIPNHRHTSHVLALYPFDQISPRTTPDLAQAVRVTLDRRMNRTDWEDVEWSRANAINYYARLLDGDRAEKSLKLLMTKLSDTDLLTVSPAGIAGARENIFAIDGNEAASAGIAEMLLQSQDGVITFLPALPPTWQSGTIKGLLARGGFEVDETWTNHSLTAATIHSTIQGICRVRTASPLTATINNTFISVRSSKKDEIEFDSLPNQSFRLTPARLPG